MGRSIKFLAVEKDSRHMHHNRRAFGGSTEKFLVLSHYFFLLVPHCEAHANDATRPVPVFPSRNDSDISTTDFRRVYSC